MHCDEKIYPKSRFFFNALNIPTTSNYRLKIPRCIQVFMTLYIWLGKDMEDGCVNISSCLYLLQWTAFHIRF